jgi:hypothetical protein
MAGAGYKLFNTGDVLTASQVNTYLMQQTIMVFASSAARTTALTGIVAEGMFSYLTDTNSTEYYDGSAWQSVSNPGDITAVTAGTGLSGGGISGAVTLAIDTATTVDKTTAQTLTNKTLTNPIINNFILGYTTTATAAGTTVLTNTSNNQQLFTGTSTQTVTMPVASTMTVGTRYVIENNSTGIVTVQSSGANTIVAIPSGMSIKITCVLASGTDATSWDFEYVGYNSLTGTGAAVFATSPTITTPVLTQGTATPSFTTNAYTLVAGNAGQFLLASNGATAGTINIPTDATYAFANGTQIHIQQTGAGQLTIQAATPGTTTVTSVGATATAPKLRVQYSVATLMKTSANNWTIYGDIA